MSWMVPTWGAPCPRCQIVIEMPWATTDLTEYVDLGTYFASWGCPVCKGRYGMELTLEGAREVLRRGARHITLSRPPLESGEGPVICDDDSIDFAMAWVPGPDETEDQVWERVWRELLGCSQSKEGDTDVS